MPGFADFLELLRKWTVLRIYGAGGSHRPRKQFGGVTTARKQVGYFHARPDAKEGQHLLGLTARVERLVIRGTVRRIDRVSHVFWNLRFGNRRSLHHGGLHRGIQRTCRAWAQDPGRSDK